ncbi:hypothetical protein J4734_25980 [Klebsiella pneumoniae]|uniref:Uncharacterized protein n=1 Tax=Klebsiella pneumoniae TaxID=573 RepID=A0A939SSQ4_KLEPN|nr:hypothetical protein [Klebsiella pneumoniae]
MPAMYPPASMRGISPGIIAFSSSVAISVQQHPAAEYRGTCFRITT